MRKEKEGLDDFGMLVLERIIKLGGPIDFDLAYGIAEWVRLSDETIPRDWKDRVATELRRRGVLTQVA